jgi:hypothetical protein
MFSESLFIKKTYLEGNTGENIVELELPISEFEKLKSSRSLWLWFMVIIDETLDNSRQARPAGSRQFVLRTINRVIFAFGNVSV